jgi:glyoxylate reductase
MAPKIFITRPLPDNAVKRLVSKGYHVDVYEKDDVIPRKKLLKTLRNGSYDVLLCLLTDKIDGEIFDAGKTLKLVVNYATGFDNIDISEAKKRNVIVANAPAVASAEAVAEHTVALMLALAAQIVPAHDYVRKGKYKGWSPSLFVGTNIVGKTLGLVGAGRIGERVAKYCHGLGLSILYSDVGVNETLEKEYGAKKADSLEALLAASDVVSLHVPLLPTTKHLINSERLSLMRPHALLVNTARGSIVDEDALARALVEGRIAGAGLDVFEHEPHVSKRLRRLPNVILTPHIASASVEARVEMADVATDAIIDFFEGRTPRTIVSI